MLMSRSRYRPSSVLDASTPMLTLEGGFVYGFTKAASAGAAGLDATLRRGG